MSCYQDLRARFDKECADAPDGFRQALEEVADIVCRRVEPYPDLCAKVSDGNVKLTDAYENMRRVAEGRVKREPGKVSCCCIAGKEAEKIILEAFGIAEDISGMADNSNIGIADSVNLFDLL